MNWTNLFTNVWALFWMLAFFGGSIFVHELGHFLAAKRRKLSVPRFSIGFGPKLFSWRRGETEYRIALLPLGGYVALPQMGETPIVEGNSRTTSVDAKPISFTDKLIVSVMGAVFNLLFAFLIACVLWKVGLPIPEGEQTTTIGYVLPQWEENGKKLPGPAYVAGLKAGDTILKIDDHPVQKFSDIEKYIILGTGRKKNGAPKAKITFEREGVFHETNLYPKKVTTNVLTKDNVRFSGILAPKQELIIERIESNSPAEKKGLLPNDRLLCVNQEPLYSIFSLQAYLEQTKGSPVSLEIERNGNLMTLLLAPEKIPYQCAWVKITDTGHETENYLEIYPAFSDASEEKAQEPPAEIKVLESTGPRFEAFKKEDSIVSFNGHKWFSLTDAWHSLENASEQTWVFEVKRNDKLQFIAIPSKSMRFQFMEPQYLYRIGIQFKQKTVLLHSTPLEQFKKSFETTFETLSRLINKNSDIKMQHLMGAPGIMRLLHRFSTDDFRRLLWFTVLLNINLAILNLLPIPVLDGGHVLFALVEKLRGKPLSAKFLNTIQGVFVAFFLFLMLYVSFFDIRRWQGDLKAEAEQAKQQRLALPLHF